MSKATQLFFGLLFGPVKSTSLQPLITGPLLWGLTSAPPELRARITEAVEKVLGAEKIPTVVKTLKWLFVLGMIRKVNGTLNNWALNNWVWSHDKKKWVWQKEVAVVTGGCGGIGALTVKGLIKRGVTVAVVDITPLPADMQNNYKIKFFECDITNEERVIETAKVIRNTVGPPSILVNNAGIADAHTILETKPAYLNKLFGVNVFSNFYTVKAFLPDMIANKKGQIVTIASSASFITVPGIVDYCASKAAVFAFHEGLNLELKHRFNAPYIITTSVHPSYVQTPLVNSWSKSLKASGTPLLTPDFVANQVVKQIFSLQGGELIIPSVNSNVPALRGWPNWMQSAILDGTSNHSFAN